MIGVPGLRGGAVDHRRGVEVPKQAPGDVEARDQLAELGQLAAGDLDPGQLGAAAPGRRRSAAHISGSARSTAR